jgi:hypothetical protein
VRTLYNEIKKNNKKKIAVQENMKKPPSKVAHNSQLKLFSVLAWLPKGPINRNPISPKAPQCRTGYLEWGLQPDLDVNISANVLYSSLPSASSRLIDW